MNNCICRKLCLPQVSGALQKLPSTKLCKGRPGSLGKFSPYNFSFPEETSSPPYKLWRHHPAPSILGCLWGSANSPGGAGISHQCGNLAELTQFLAGHSRPRGPWGRAVRRGGTQPSTAGKGGCGGPEELSTFVRLGAAVFAACLRVGGRRHWDRHAGQGGQRRRQWGARWVVVVLLPQKQPWKHREVSHIAAHGKCSGKEPSGQRVLWPRHFCSAQAKGLGQSEGWAKG